MQNEFYDAIFKRKSFHLFRNVGAAQIAAEELAEIEAAFEGFARLYPQIKTAMRIVPAQKVHFKRDAQYCILLYSEKKENYLMNMGYLGQQLELYLVGKNIGTLWFGIGKPDEAAYQGLDYVIMIAIHKIDDETKFRKDLYKAKRKPIEEIWSGEDPGIADIARFAPSACNSQPWYVESKNGMLTVYRYQKPGKRGIMPADAVSYYNRIDVGIFLCILELCMEHQHIAFERKLYPDDGESRELTKSADYRLLPAAPCGTL